MSSFNELRCPLECRITSKDNARGHVYAIIDYGPEADLLFMVILNGGDVWCAPARDVRIAANWSLGRS